MLVNSQRLHFDLLRCDDAAALFQYRADPRVARYQSWRPSSITAVQEFIAAQQALAAEAQGSWVQRAIRLRADGRLIGDLGIHVPCEPAGSVEFGITIAPAQQHRGYASEAVRALFAHVFGSMHRHRVHASVDPRNVASMALLRGAHMRQEAYHRESLWLREE